MTPAEPRPHVRTDRQVLEARDILQSAHDELVKVLADRDYFDAEIGQVTAARDRLVNWIIENVPGAQVDREKGLVIT